MEPGGSMPHSQGLSNNPYLDPNQPYASYHISCPFFFAMVVPNYQYSSEALYNVSYQRWFLQCEVVSLTSSPQAGGPLVVGSRLLIQYIRS